jgi:general secretion pathway protein D
VDATSFGDLGNPSFSNQEIETTAVVADGSVIALGGMIQEEEIRENNGIPGLRKIPGLGALFSYRSTENVRRELFVILRPQIIDPAEANTAAQQEFRDQFERLKEAIEAYWP